MPDMATGLISNADTIAGLLQAKARLRGSRPDPEEALKSLPMLSFEHPTADDHLELQRKIDDWYLTQRDARVADNDLIVELLQVVESINRQQLSLEQEREALEPLRMAGEAGVPASPPPKKPWIDMEAIKMASALLIYAVICSLVICFFRFVLFPGVKGDRHSSASRQERKLTEDELWLATYLLFLQK